MSKQEQQLADQLDAFLTAKLNGQETTVTADLPPVEARLAAELVEMADAAVPDADFLVNLEAKLVRNSRRAASRKFQSQKINKPERLNFWQEFTLFIRSLTMKRTLITLGAVVTVFVVALFAMNFLGKEDGDTQVADLPPTEVADTVTESESVVVPDVSEPAENSEAAVTSGDSGESAVSVIPSDPSELAMLPMMEAVQDASGSAASTGRGGGGIAEGAPAPAKDMAMMIAPDFSKAFSEATYVMNTTLPLEPTAATVSQRVYTDLTMADARRIADQLGFSGPLYTEIINMEFRPMPEPADTTGSDTGEGVSVDRPVEETSWEPPLQFFVFDGDRILNISGNSVNIWSYRADYDYNQEVPQAKEIAQAYLLERGLIDYPYELGDGYSSGEVFVYRLVNGQPLNEPDMYIQVTSSGEIMYLNFHQAFSSVEAIGNYPLISAEAAWQLIQDGVVENNISFQIMPDTMDMVRPMPMEEPFDMPKFWQRERQPGQETHLFSWFQAYKLAEGEGAPRIEMAGYILTGSEADLTAMSEQLGQMAHVQGRLAEDGRQFEVTSWEIIPEPTPLSMVGNVQFSEGVVLFVSSEGETFIIPDAPADLPDGMKVNIFGWTSYDAGMAYPILEWENLDEWFDWENNTEVMPLPELILSDEEYVDPFQFSEIRIDEVSMVYRQTYDYSSFDKQMRPPTFVQPAWEFKGVTDLGDTITLSVQAVSPEYLQSP